MVAAALSEEVYRRDTLDQKLSSNDYEGFGDSTPTNFLGSSVAHFTYSDGYYYNYNTGFVGRVVEANGKIFVVLRGRDLSGGWIPMAAASLGVDLAPSYADVEDWSDNRKLGLGRLFVRIWSGFHRWVSERASGSSGAGLGPELFRTPPNAVFLKLAQ
jgi:hypothetical protein